MSPSQEIRGIPPAAAEANHVQYLPECDVPPEAIQNGTATFWRTDSDGSRWFIVGPSEPVVGGEIHGIG